MISEKNRLNNYVLDLLEAVNHNLSAYKKDKDPESIHNLRVNIKKIKAVFSFAEKIYKEKHDTSLLMPLFKKAGKIREMQINNRVLSAVPQFPESLISELKMKEDILIRQFLKNTSLYKNQIRDFREKASLSEKLPDKKTIIKYFEKESSKAKSILQNTDREGMHRFRKKIKIIMYMYDVLPLSLQNKIDLNEAEINKQQKSVGVWHDTNAILKFLSDEHPVETSEYILKLRTKEKRQFNLLLKNLSNWIQQDKIASTT